MENLVKLSVNLVVCFSWLGILIPSVSSFPSQQDTQHGAWTEGDQTSKQIPYEQRRPVTETQTVTVLCHPDFMEITVKADLFEVGTPVNVDELRLGVYHRDSCTAAVSSADEYRIVVGLSDCGTRHLMSEDSLIYTNLLIYSPMQTQDGLIRMDEAVIPIECHYGRKYSLSSSSLRPTWIPFTTTQAAVELLDFDLRVMTSDWMYERGSKVFYLGEPINIEASVRVGHHMGFRMFVSSCVATLDPDANSVPRYIFIDNDGCLVDSQLQESHSHFLPRIQDDKLQFTIDAFRFHTEDRGELYMTCHLTAVPITNHADPQHKACTSHNGRWRSADGSDYLCSFCQGQNVDHAASTPVDSQLHGNFGAFGPRGYGKPGVSDNFWRSGVTSDDVLERETGVGPMLVLPSRYKMGPLPPEDLPPLLHKLIPSYGSQWRGGIKIGRYPFDDISSPEESDEEESFEEEEFSEKDLAKGLVPGPRLMPTPEPGTLGLTTEALVKKSSKAEQDKRLHLEIDPEKRGNTLKDWDGKDAVKDEDEESHANETRSTPESRPSQGDVTQEAEVHSTAAPSNSTVAPSDPTAAPSNPTAAPSNSTAAPSAPTAAPSKVASHENDRG